MMWSPQSLPFDVLPPILSQLNNRRDWHACALVSKTFNRVATPLLYHTLDSRVISKDLLYHPSTTLLSRPELAQYVRKVTETGAVHCALVTRYPNITQDTLKALSLCVNLASLTWVDDSEYTGASSPLLTLLSIIPSLPLRSLTIRTHSDLGDEAWTTLSQLRGLRKISVWCMDGPPRVLQGWAEHLGPTLTHLELGRCAGVPPTILITVLMQLPLLQDLRLKGAPAAAIPMILAYLPNLRNLDTEYLQPSTSAVFHRMQVPDLPHPFPSLRRLTVRTSSTDTLGPRHLFPWICLLLPSSSLESLTLHAFTNSNMGHISIPRMFILDLARTHGKYMKEFLVGEAMMTLADVECLCSLLQSLESLSCAVASPDVGSIIQAISTAEKLNTLKLQVQWIPNLHDSQSGSNERAGSWNKNIRFDPHYYSIRSRGQAESSQFTIEDARRMMLRTDQSVLRNIGIRNVSYTGKWVLDENHDEKVNHLRFQVVQDVAEDYKWYA